MGVRELLRFDSVTHHRVSPRDHDPNANPPIGTVGPQSTGGEIMSAEAWAGWPDAWATPYLEPIGSDEYSGFGYGRGDPAGYWSRVSTVMTCVDLNSSQLASFPVYGVRGLDTVPLPSWAENPEPIVYADWSDFVLAAANSLYLRGEAIVWATARFADGFPSRFVCLARDAVEIEPDGAGGIRYELAGEPLDTADVCHIRYQVMAGRVTGVSPLEWIGRHLTSAAALADYATDIARHGVWVVLRHPSNLSTKQRDDAKTNWVQSRRANPAAPAVVSGGFALDFPNLSPTDMALLDLRTMDDQRICAAFRTPPYLVGVDQPGTMTYTNASGLTDHHWRVGLRTAAKKIATALSAWALPRGTRLEFDRDEYVRPGPLERAQYYATLAGVEQGGEPAMTVGEIRIAERLRGSVGDRIGSNP